MNSFAQAYAHMLSLWPVQPASQDLEGTRLQVWGEGAPLLLLPGMKTTSTSWASLAEPLGQRFHCRAADVPGDCGYSQGRPRRLEELLEWLSGLIGSERPHIVGMSYGAWLGLEFALRWPQRVSKLVLIGPAGILNFNLAFILRGLPMILWPRRAFVDSYLRWAAVPSPDPRYEPWMRGLVDVMHQGIRESRRALMPLPARPVDLSALRTPTKLILGREEKIYSARAAERRVGAAMSTMIVPDASHDVIFSQADQVAREVLDFLA